MRACEPVEPRFWPKVEKTATCWMWRGARDGSGYGQIHEGGRKGRRIPAHRWSYQQLHGPVPQGLELDHLCRTRACVNPAHLEPVTRLENVRRGQGHGSETHCPQGHPYDAANTYHHRGERQCRACRARHRANHRRAVVAREV